jgi:HEAT repeat protein
MSDPKYGTAEQIMALPAPKLVSLLQDSSASEYAKAKACQRLAVIGDGSAAPALAPLLDSPHLSTYARTALESIPGPAADDALRSALQRTKGPQLIGVINSIGKRRDPKAIAQLGSFRAGSDPEVAKAADAALARIRPIR